MRGWPVALAAIVMVAGAQGARSLARTERGLEAPDKPVAPSPETARIASLGYNEAAADLLFFRLVGYFGGTPTATGVADLVEAIVALDPKYQRIYEWGARAMSGTPTFITIDVDWPRALAAMVAPAVLA